MKKFLLLLLLASPVQAAILCEDVAREIEIVMLGKTTGTPTTGIAAASVTIRYVKNDMTSASFTPTASAGSNDWTEIGNGTYRVEFTAAQLDTAGTFSFTAETTTEVGLSPAYDIYPTATCAVTIGGSPATLLDMWSFPKASIDDANSIGYWLKINADVPTSHLGMVEAGTAQAGAATSITLSASASVIPQFFRYKRIYLVSSTGAGQTAIINSYNETTKVALISCEGSSTGAWFTNPDSSTGYVILPRNR